MTVGHIAVQDARGLKVPNATVKIADRLTTMVVGSGTTDDNGSVQIDFTGTPFGGYRVDVVTPKGYKGTQTVGLNWVAANFNMTIKTSSPDEGSISASAADWWNQRAFGDVLGMAAPTNGTLVLIGGGALAIYLLFFRSPAQAQQSSAPIIITGGK